MLGELICILAVALTTAGAYLSGRMFFAAKGSSLRGVLAAALTELVECLGAFAVFLAANVALGILVIIAVRAVTSRFVSLYVIDNFVLILLSAFQAFVFRRWWRLG